MAAPRSSRIGVYGSLEKALTAGLRVAEHYSDLDSSLARRARELGLVYVPVVWVPEAKSPSEGVVDAFGRRSLFAFGNSGCISRPSVRRRAAGKIEKAATELEAKAVILDALRFPSPHDGQAFFSCFCPYCREALREHGANPDELQSRLRELAKNLYRYPHLPLTLLEALHEWIRTRQCLVGEALTLLREEARRYGVELRAAVFPPSLAWLVGQNYSLLAPRLSEVHVMLYHKCSGAACLNHELRCLAETVGAKSALRMFTGIEAGDPSRLEDEGLPVDIIVEEAERAKSILGDAMVPILQLDEQGLSVAEKLRAWKTAYLA